MTISFPMATLQRKVLERVVFCGKLVVLSSDPRDGRFPGDPHGRVGWGWGGVGWGMITFFALAHMVGATQHHLSCTCTHGRCYATSWDGVGWGGG